MDERCIEDGIYCPRKGRGGFTGHLSGVAVAADESCF